MIVINGLYGIKVTVLADSISKAGHRFTSYEVEYPRIVLAELNTHRMLSKNSFSSRAVPFDKMLLQLGGRPVRFGANQAGMQDKGEDFDAVIPLPFESEGQTYTLNYTPVGAWEAAKCSAIGWARGFKEAGYHKQVYNRLLEPWQMMKTVLSGTEWANFDWLRNHEAADPTFRELARCISEAKALSEPQLLLPGEWHLPYINSDVYESFGERVQSLWIDEHFEVVGDSKIHPHLTIEQAIKISCARCAAVSYRNEGYGLEKSLQVYDNLVGSDRKHASAFEHQATPMREAKFGVITQVVNGVTKKFKDLANSTNISSQPETWEPGVTHMDRNRNLWSGNIKGFIQYRKLIPGENYEG